MSDEFEAKAREIVNSFCAQNNRGVFSITEESSFSLMKHVAQALRDAQPKYPSDDEITAKALDRAKEAGAERLNPRLMYIRGINYGARWAIDFMKAGK